jgi:hypothetical protein
MVVPKRLQKHQKASESTDEPEIMYRGSGAVNSMIGTPVQLKGGSHLSFVVGTSIRPTIEDVRYVYQKLYKSKYVNAVTPEWAVPELLVRASVEEQRTLLPAVLTAVNDIIEYQEYEHQDLYFLCVVAYVLAWYDHLNLGGPRPIVEAEREKRTVAHHQIARMEIILRCEYCNKVFTPPAHLVRYEKVAQAYLRWLPKHYWEYHKWATFKPAVRKSKKSEETQNA